MLERGWVTIMASDAHDTDARPPRLRPGVARAAQLIGERAARDLVEAMPRRIVEGAGHDLPTHRPDAVSTALLELTG